MSRPPRSPTAVRRPRRASPAAHRRDGGAPSIYADITRGASTLDEAIPALLSVVAPHVEALEGTEHPLAMLLGERLRRSLVRLEPLLDETLGELKALKEADMHVAACAANLRERMLTARRVLADATGRPVPIPEALRTASHHAEFNPRLLKTVERWEVKLRQLGTDVASQASNGLLDGVRALADAKHGELRSRLVLDDAHDVLRHALEELVGVGLACEEAFPDIAGRVIPRPLEDETPTPVGRFEVQ